MTSKFAYFILLFIIFSSKGLQSQSNTYNYSDLNSTTISAEYLSKEMLLEVVSDGPTENGSWKQNYWHSFEFEKIININHIELTFDNNTCLDDCKLEFEIILSDTIIDLVIKELYQTISINHSSNFLMLKRKFGSPSGPGHISEIRILSHDRPNDLRSGKPIINLNRKYRLNIKYLISGKSKQQIKEYKKLWKSRMKFYEQSIKQHINPIERYKFEDVAFYGLNDNEYCYMLNPYINKLTNIEVVQLFDNCHCEIRSTFFARKIEPTNFMMQKEFKFIGTNLIYKEDRTEKALVKYLENGNAWAGHAIPHLCLMGKSKYISKIDSLKNDQNIFTQVQVIKGLTYFGEHKKALDITMSIYNKEIKSLRIDSISIFGTYAWEALRIMNEYFPDKILPLILNLFQKYRSLYPVEMKLNKNIDEVIFYDQKYFSRIQSFQGSDVSILEYIKSYLYRFPHLIDNPMLRGFNSYIKESSP
jgi:hypothetical protein